MNQDTTSIRLDEDIMVIMGWSDKYKSCHNDWTKDGMLLHQSEDEDEFGEPIRDYDFYVYESIESNTPIRWMHELLEYMEKSKPK